MRKSNQQTLGQLLNILVKENHLSSGLTLAELQNGWKDIAGEFIAKHTIDLKIVKNILYIRMDNAACREELMYRRSELMQEVNKVSLGVKITEIVIR
jgi:hypothetical protein